MQPAQLCAQLVGPIGFPVTPFREDLSLDLQALEKNVQDMLKHPPVAIVAAGGTGELYSLTPAEHRAVVDVVVRAGGDRVPVIAGVGFNAAIAVELAPRVSKGRRAGDSRVSAGTYPQADDDGLVEYYKAIGAATPLALLVYSRDWFHPGPALVKRLTDSIPTLVAWKDGQGDIRRLQVLMSRIGSRLHWIGGAGDDMVPAYLAAGVRAFTSSVSNVSSRVARQLHEWASERSGSHDQQLERLLSELVVPMYAMRGRRRGYEVTVMKELMNLLGLGGGVVRPPLPQMTAEDLAELRTTVPGWRAAL